MADEITPILQLTVDMNGKSRTISPTSVTEDKAASGYIDNVAYIGFAAHEALVLGDIATPGLAYFRNCDATNFVQIGVDVAAAFVPFLKLLPGQYAMCWLATAAPYAKADTASVKLDYMICDR